MWELSPTAEYAKKLRRWPSKHRQELKNMLDNLDTLQRTLREGAKRGSFWFGFLHDEKMGVLAVDQKGPGAGLKQTRLYIYPDEDDKVLYLITLGDKKSQHADVKVSHEFVLDHRNRHEEEKDGGVQNG
jgi:hypothetical protein